MKFIPRTATRSPGPRVRTALLGLLVLGALGVAPSAASASDMSISTESTTVKEDTQNPYTASGTADKRAFAFVRVFVDQGSGCPQNSGASPAPGSSVTPETAQEVNGPFRYSGTFFVNSAGSYLLCGYVKSGPDETLATAITAFRAIGDTDGDGVYDDQDRCPNEFGTDERTPNTRSADGCPIRDGDRDGLRNEEDRCPTEPGFDSRTGQRTADGCPIRDSDGDGVVDGSDRCPSQNARTADGCPVPAAAPQPTPLGFRAIVVGHLFGKSKSSVLGSPVQVLCTRICDMTATAKITVSAAAKKKYKLKSAVIASGSGSEKGVGKPFNNSTLRLLFGIKASKDTSKKLRKLKKIKARYTMAVTGTVDEPRARFEETVTVPVTVLIGENKTAKRFQIQSESLGDPKVESGDGT